MSNIKALEKLRELATGTHSYISNGRVLEFVNEIEQEIAERYIELPVDADGVPIHIGDELFNKNKPTDTYKVTAIADNGYLRIYHDTAHIHSSQCRHVKPRTIEDVLREFADEVERCCDTTDTIAEYAEEIRGMMA